MTGQIGDIGIEWVLLGLRIFFIAALYLFLFQVARLMLREITALAAASQQPLRQRFPATPLPFMAGLVIVDPGETMLESGLLFPMAGDVLIGRSYACDLILDDQFVSGEHAEISITPQSTRLTDLGSRNGTRVNGEEVAAPVTLFDGDIVQFGNVRLRYAASITVDEQT